MIIDGVWFDWDGVQRWFRRPLCLAGFMKYGLPPLDKPPDTNVIFQYWTHVFGPRECNMKCTYCCNKHLFNGDKSLRFNEQYLDPNIPRITLTLGEPGVVPLEEINKVVGLRDEFEIFVKTNGFFVEKYGSEDWFSDININVDYKVGLCDYTPPYDFGCMYKEVTYPLWVDKNDDETHLSTMLNFYDRGEFDKLVVILVLPVITKKGVLFSPGYDHLSYHALKRFSEVMKWFTEHGCNVDTHLSRDCFERLNLQWW